jgi:hypothetical protein
VTDAVPFILADAGDDFGKIIFGILVFVIWGIGALVKMSKGSAEQARRRQEQLDAAIRAQVESARQREAAASALGQQRMGQAMPPPPPVFQRQQQHQQRQPQHQRRQPRPPALPPALRQPPVATRAQVPPQRQQAKKQPQKRRVAPQQQPQRVMPPEDMLEEVPRVAESEIGHGAVPASPARRRAATALTLRLTPQSIKQQFILAEILQRPVALRDGPAL